jgi:hypothetical protein
METWSALLPLSIAEHEAAVGTPLYTIQEICDHFGITEETLGRYKQQPAFRAEVRAALLELKDSNSIVRKKAKAQFESYLDKLIPKFLHDEDFPPSEKVKLLQFLAKTARLIDDPAEKLKIEQEASAKNQQQQQPPSLNLTLQVTQAPASPPQGMTIIYQEPEKVVN